MQAGSITRVLIAASVSIVAACASGPDGPALVERRDRITFDALPPVDVRLLLPPEHVRRAADYISAAAAALERFGEWYGPYPHSELTLVVDGWRDSAVEPGAAVVRSRWLSFARSGALEAAVFDAVARRFWEPPASQMSPDRAWLVDALSLYSSAKAQSEVLTIVRFEEPRFFGGFVPYVLRSLPLTRGDIRRATSRNQTGVERHALAFSTLERYLGWGTLQTALWRFAERQRTGAATPQELFTMLSEISGRDVTWFVDEAFRSTRVFDYGIEALENRSIDPQHYETAIVVRRYGDAVFSGTSRPRDGSFQSGAAIETVVTFASGDEVRERWDGRDPSIRYVYTSTSPAVAAIVDPDHVLQLDANPANNGRKTGRATRAAAVWTARWLIWLEDLMVTYAFFV